MAGTSKKKQLIAEELARDRMRLKDDLVLLRRNLDVPWRIIECIRHSPWEWVTTGFMFGWILFKPKPGGGLWSFVRARFLSFAMVGGIYANTYGSLVEPKEHAVKVQRTEREVKS
jgi:hypothetical protein